MKRWIVLLFVISLIGSSVIGIRGEVKSEISCSESRENCQRCNGTGQEKCPVCGGVGIQAYNILGIKVFPALDNISIVCTRCHGSGKIVCTLCGGTGVLP